MSRTYVYIDGFNLYYGCVKGSPYRWLNLDTLSRIFLQASDEIVAIKYFTARVSARPDDPHKPIRQEIYFRALRTVPHISIILGQFRTHSVPMIRSGTNPPKTVLVDKTEEKGSDVNLAAHLLMDGFMRRYDLAVVVSNDSDLAEPVKMVRRELGLAIGVLNPHPTHSHQLSQHAIFKKRIRGSDLAMAQFPETLVDSKGTFTKPAKW
jgi:hypothetical protein